MHYVVISSEGANVYYIGSEFKISLKCVYRFSLFFVYVCRCGSALYNLNDLFNMPLASIRTFGLVAGCVPGMSVAEIMGAMSNITSYG